MPPAIAPSLLDRAKKAVPPPPVPRGYFDAIFPVARQLLDNGLKLSQAADWLICEGGLDPDKRGCFYNAMKMRFSRLRARQARKTEVFHWRAALGYQTAHAIGNGTVALCGVRAGRWFETKDTALCKHCRGIVTIEKVTIL